MQKTNKKINNSEIKTSATLANDVREMQKTIFVKLSFPREISCLSITFEIENKTKKEIQDLIDYSNEFPDENAGIAAFLNDNKYYDNIPLRL
jgi:hypothetical protein